MPALPTPRRGSSTSPNGSCRAAASTCFSYADVAAELGISKASLHYHFPGKAELGEALIGRYASRFADALEEINRRGGDNGSASESAQMLVSGLEGAMLIARPYGDVTRFQAAATRLLTSLASAAPRPRHSPSRT